ncbi:DUF7002 family protein [Pseudomonas syringae pv. coryli]|uniref:DUF7002 family protein n=1 Tax=Pseudomonas syringae pv. coryli TaxID=317659 RepID=UPI0009E42349|nr:hypothetical protein [Pseudomonas syringae pv. coryli]
MKVQKLIEAYPEIYHMAEVDTWPSIKQIGLLSASAALTYHAIANPTRFQLESSHRPQKVCLTSTGHPNIVLRDQKPMNDARLMTALQGSATPQQWYELLNSKVFFWAEHHRLEGLLNARAYKNLEHDVLTIDTRSLLNDYENHTWLCHMNSGNTFPYATARTPAIFQTIANYPSKRDGTPAKDVVEVVIENSIPNISQYVTQVRRMKGSQVIYVIQ